MEFEKRLHEITAPVVLKYADEKWPHQESYIQALTSQQKKIKNMSCISPAEMFKHIASTLCKTDMENDLNFLEQARQYRQTFYNYYHENKIFSSYKYITAQPEHTIPLTREEGDAMEKKWKKEAKPESTFDLSSFGYHDLSDIPRFHYSEPAIIKGLQQQLYLISIIIGVCIILFWLTYISFIKYDVR